MHRTTAVLTLALFALPLAAPCQQKRPAAAETGPDTFSGELAMRHTRAAVAFGPRPSGSPEIRKLQSYILAQLKPLGCEVSEHRFTAQTPAGPLPMLNIIARFRGSSGSAVAVTGHYDTKRIPGTHFVGANDAGSSTGWLLELARVLSRRKPRNDTYLVWLDGEEAVAQWSDTDSLYGSRQLVQRWASEGLLGRLKAVINVDMVGDKALGLQQDMNSSPELVRLVWQVARQLGHGQYFQDRVTAIEDDHVPFRRVGVEAVDLIDFDYGPDNSYWHTGQDTLDKLSPRSLQIIGDVVLEVLRRLES